MNKIALLFLIILIGSMWLVPVATPTLSILFLLFSLGVAISAIFKKHKGTEGAGAKIITDILILIGTLALIIVLGGLAGLLVNYYAHPYLGPLAGFLLAILASLFVGYVVKKAITKLIT